MPELDLSVIPALDLPVEEAVMPKLEVAVISTLIIWLVAELWNLIQEDPEDGEGAEGH